MVGMTYFALPISCFIIQLFQFRSADVHILNLTFMGPCVLRILQYISKKMQRYAVYLYLKTAIHVSGGTSTHHQEHIQLYLQHLVFVVPLLLPAAIVEELEPV